MKISEREQHRREKQRQTPRPAYCSIGDADVSLPVTLGSDLRGGAQNIAARPRPPPTAPPSGRSFIRMRAVLAKTGLPVSSLYDLMATGKFPRPVALSSHRVGWVLDEVERWIETRIAERDDQPVERRRSNRRATAP